MILHGKLFLKQVSLSRPTVRWFRIHRRTGQTKGCTAAAALAGLGPGGPGRHSVAARSNVPGPRVDGWYWKLHPWLCVTCTPPGERPSGTANGRRLAIRESNATARSGRDSSQQSAGPFCRLQGPTGRSQQPCRVRGSRTTSSAREPQRAAPASLRNWAFQRSQRAPSSRTSSGLSTERSCCSARSDARS